jgi:MFS family permease
LRTLRTFQAFHSPSFRLLWTANFFSFNARWMQMTLLAWMVLVLTDSPWRVALVGFFGMAPMFVLGIVGGVLADRVDLRRLLVVTQATSLVASLAMTLLLITGLAQFWHAYLTILVIGTGHALDMPSRRYLIHHMLGRSGTLNGLALDSVGMQLSKMVGPALAGLLIITVDVGGGYVVVSLSYLLATVLTRLLQLSHDSTSPARSGAGKIDTPSPGEATARGTGQQDRRGRDGVLGNLVEGLRYVRTSDAIMAVVLSTVVMNLLLFPYMQMVPVIARDVLGVGPGLMGVLIATEGLGAFAGAVVIASLGNISSHGRVYMGGSMLAMVVLLFFSFSRWYLLSIPLMLVMGVGIAGFGTMQAAIVMLVAREEMRGRALGVVSLAIGAGPLGVLMIGAVAVAVSPTFAIGLNAVLGMILLSLVGLLIPSLMRRALEQGQATAEPRKAA